MELNLTNVTKKYGKYEAISNQSLILKNGVYGLLGINGAGKTTLMNMICTLSKPSGGSIMFNGKDIYKLDGKYREILGYLPQNFGYYPDLNILDYMRYIACLKGIETDLAEKRIDYLIKKVGLEKEIKKKMRSLSGGMLRRVGIAQAMINDPKVLVLDEPTAGLDPNERIRFRNLISEIARDKIVLLSTHIVSDVEHIAEEIIMINKGKIFLQGQPMQIISSLDTKAWTCNIHRDKVDFYLKNFLVVSSKSTSNGVELRIISKEIPISGAKEEEKTLEDAFLYYFGREGKIL
ncbi:ABC transporter ATP-binding protein [Streptococcus ovuberis]|uniref:ABC transporter ATP-binding protein n=1 Tax=Streptococcus ovuberis TaxID=1936207 RepID=A0A7X6S155_9STRE|nr:ABC transporter ATP-binding protein [Streptococcus ovuberis]NKZ20824.1 ABC transporter ATP-binding protein [Streptococcus ovuberis]